MLNRLRRHRWLWALALVAISFKLVAGTVCLNDAAAGELAAATTASALPSESVVAAVVAADAAACMLGEAASGCHCACPESLPVPTTVAVHFSPSASHFVFATPAYAFAPARAGPMLRPPIA